MCTTRTRTKEGNRMPLSVFLRYTLQVLGSITMIYPVLWMLTIALKPNDEVFKIPPEFLPSDFLWSNFIDATTKISFWPIFLNTSIITVAATIGAVVSSILIGYGISRINFPGRNFFFYIFLGSQMLPGMVSLVPTFVLFKSIGWYNTWYPLIVPAFLGNPFFIFLARQFFRGIPKSYDEAAKIDGAGHWKILWKVIVPMCMPMVVTMVIFQFRGSWNDYLGPLIYLGDKEMWTLSLAIKGYMGGMEYGSSWNLFMAADLIYMMPMLLLFFFAQKYFMQGLGSLNSAGIK
ncbi:carbohydrate ABC transporter permease [Cohnella luojiensis]|uniref:Carbohydrate ABC transporter permease n=2 Tax=Cohnella luojiensis TaxID=652876 RepID=A0A4Y8LRY8_9BACL|nr:carbohydrate ABC transporter permease [Cohnella luojiensis]